MGARALSAAAAGRPTGDILRAFKTGYIYYTLYNSLLRLVGPEGNTVAQGRSFFTGLSKVLRPSRFGHAVAFRSRFGLYFLWERRWFFAAMLLGALLLSAPVPEGLTREGMVVLTMSVVAIILYITEPIPLPAVALLIIVGPGRQGGMVRPVVAVGWRRTRDVCA